MQTDRRHELEENVLAEKTFELYERLRPYVTSLLMILAAGLVAGIAMVLISSQLSVSRAQSWDACLAALSGGTPDSFNDVMQRYPGTPAAQWSQIMLADTSLADGAELLFRNRLQAELRLQSAIELYTSVIVAKPQGMLAERAIFGLAKARESLGELDAAKQGYEVVAAEYPSGAMARLAADHAASLGREQSRQWYDWFAAQKITPVDKPGTDLLSIPATDTIAFPATDSAAVLPPVPDSQDAVEDALFKQE